MSMQPAGSDELLTPAQVAAILYVDPKTVTRWAIAGKIHAIRTPGGHRRYLRTEILGLRHSDSSSGPRSARSGSAQTGSRLVGTSEPTSALGSVTGSSDDSAAAAASVVAQAVSTARDAQALVVAEGVTVVARAVMHAADRVAGAAEVARKARALAACTAAETVASKAAEAAAETQRRADVAALRLTEAASLAASVVAGASLPGAERQDSSAARQLAMVVEAAAVSTAGERVAAASSVAAAVAAAAADVALVVSAADLAIEREVARTARALQVVASMTARQVAADSEERADHIALLAYDTAAAVRSRGPLAQAAASPERNRVPAKVPSRFATI